MVRFLAGAVAWMPFAALACTPAVFLDGFESGVVCGADPNVRIAIAALPTARAATLGTSAQFAVRVRACGYSGTVSLEAIGLPDGWSASYPQASIEVNDGEIHETMLTVDVPSTAIAACEPFAATAQVPAQEVVSADLLLDVENVFLVIEPEGTDAGVHPYPALIRVKAGATVRFRNDDVSQHVLHGEGIIPHEANFAGAPGRIIDVVTAAPGETGSFYCHSHGTGVGLGSLIVE